MRKEAAEIKKTIATLINGINIKNQKKGVNAQYKYKTNPIRGEIITEDGEKEVKGWEFSLIVSELGYPERELQSFKFQKPNNIDRFTMEYQTYLTVLSELVETALFTISEVGKGLNKDIKFQQEAIKSEENGKEVNRDTNK